MALNKELLKQAIIKIMTDMRVKEIVSDQEYAERLATAIDEYVKTAAIVYKTGLISPAGAVTGVFEGNLN